MVYLRLTINEVKIYIEKYTDINLVEGFNISSALRCNSESNIKHGAVIFETLRIFIKTINKTHNFNLNKVSIIGVDGSKMSS